MWDCCGAYKKLTKTESQEHFEFVQVLGFDVTYDDVHAEFEKLRLRRGRLLCFSELSNVLCLSKLLTVLGFWLISPRRGGKPLDILNTVLRAMISVQKNQNSEKVGEVVLYV